MFIRPGNLDGTADRPELADRCLSRESNQDGSFAFGDLASADPVLARFGQHRTRDRNDRAGAVGLPRASWRVHECDRLLVVRSTALLRECRLRFWCFQARPWSKRSAGPAHA